MATAVTLTMSLVAHEQRAFAQEQQEQESSAEAAADTSDANAEASADAEATHSDAHADSQATTSESSSTEGTTQNQSSPTDDSQNASDQNAQSRDQNATGNQSSQGTPGTIPAPAQDSNAAPQGERSRLVEGQQPGQQDSATDRGRTDATDRGRANYDERQGRGDDRRGRDRGDDLRVGVEFGRATDRGLTINNVERNSFFFRSGFRRGDVIVSVHGRPIRSDADFTRLLVLQPGQRVPVIVLRDGRRETIYVVYDDVAYDDRSPQRPIQAGGAYLGVVFDPQARDAAVVSSVNPGSPAQEAGIQSGDIIVAMNGQEVRSYPEAISMVRQMRPGDELPIVIERARGENEVVAILDQRPNVRTAARPESQQYGRQGIVTDESAQVEVQVEDRDQNGGLLNRNRNSDGSRRGLLPRSRN
jgi:membrane-associated protease RseP (regulator of RpoE activity)